jgi:hypothetical protein
METIKSTSQLGTLNADLINNNGLEGKPITLTLTWGKILRYLAIIIILSILGLNLFSYLGIATELISKITAPILRLFGIAASETTKAAVNVGAAGIKAGAGIVAGSADVVAGTVTGGLNVLENTLSNGITRNNIDGNYIVSTNKALNDAEKNITNSPEPDYAGSEIQLSKTSGKTGFCFIGEDRGFRNCVSVTENDQCMSGDIFPTREICINPSLRQ